MSQEKEVLYWECIRKGVNDRDLKRLLDLHADEQNKELRDKLKEATDYIEDRESNF